MPKRMLTIYAVSHFLVDFSCAFLMFFHLRDASSFPVCLLVYNFCAFAMQMPFGIVADWLNRNARFAAVGCLLVAAAHVFAGVPLAAAAIAGLGNGMYHIGGGVDVLNYSEKKSGALGIFVSPGALGIFLGALLGRGEGLPQWVPLGTLVVAAVAILALRRGIKLRNNAAISFRAFTPGNVIAILCLFFVVCLRSFAGLTMPFAWKGIGTWGIVLVCSVVLGKVAGGFFADRFGFVRAAFISLGLSAVFFCFADVPFAGVLAAFFFNMTMPITLWAVAKIMPGAKGFTFGLLTFALFLGYLPMYFDAKWMPQEGWAFAILALCSVVLLVPGLRKAMSHV